MAEKWNSAPSGSEVYDGFAPSGGTNNASSPHAPGRCSSASTPHQPVMPVRPASYMTPVASVGIQATIPAQSGMPSTGDYQMHSNTCDFQKQSDSENKEACFICCDPVPDRNFELLKTSMNHSHAPLIVLLSDVLGYKLEAAKLHSKIVCQRCFHLLDIIDELQQTLAESKTDVRTKFLATVQRLKLKYARTDKMLKPRCLRCIQLAQSTARKKGRGGRGLRGRAEESINKSHISQVKGRGQAYNSPREDGHGQPPTCTESDNENVTVLEVEPEIEIEEDGEGNRGNSSSKLTPKDSSDVVFDDDLACFSPDEKLKVGLGKEVNGRRTFFCMYCQVQSDTELSLKVHVRVYHMPVLVYDNGQGTVETRYRMGIKLQNTTPTEFSATEKPFACLLCESSYKLQSSLQTHFREHHSPHKPYQCQECKEGFRRPIDLSRHRLYRCPARKLPVISKQSR